MLCIEYCPDCGREVEYELENDKVAVSCPTEDCENYFIHCDLCRNFGVDWAPAICSVDTCPWRPEACPECGGIIPIHNEVEGAIECVFCGESHTKDEYVNSWED